MVFDIALMNAWDCHVYVSMYICTYVLGRLILEKLFSRINKSCLIPAYYRISGLRKIFLHITFLYSRTDFLSVFIVLRLSLIILTVAIKHESWLVFNFITIYT